MPKRMILRSDERVLRSDVSSGKRRLLRCDASSGESKKRRTDKRGPVLDERSGEKIVGVWTTRSAEKYASMVFDPVKKKRIWLGTFDTIQQASEAYNAKKQEIDQGAERCEEFEWVEIEEENKSGDHDDHVKVRVLNPDQFQTQTNPESSWDLRKEMVSVKSSKYNGGGAMGFMIPVSGGARKVFTPVIDNQGFLMGRFSEGDVGVLDDWLSAESSRDLRKEMVSVKSDKYNGGGATGFMIPVSGGLGKLFLPVIDNDGCLIGRIGKGDLSILDDWLSTL